MTKQIVNIVQLNELYNILSENENILSFKVKNYPSNEGLIQNLKNDKKNLNNSTFVICSSNNVLLKDIEIDKRNILIIENFPIEFNKLIELINVHLIKQKYNFQSKLSIKDYTIDLNSRNINKENKKLKLTERELDIIMFLKNHKTPQKIEILQNQIWKYSSNLETHTVETHVYRLRKKISKIFKDDNFIKYQPKMLNSCVKSVSKSPKVSAEYTGSSVNCKLYEQLKHIKLPSS